MCNAKVRREANKVLVVFFRFRKLAGHYLVMYPNLNINIEEELEQLKVRKQPDSGICIKAVWVFFTEDSGSFSSLAGICRETASSGH